MIVIVSFEIKSVFNSKRIYAKKHDKIEIEFRNNLYFGKNLSNDNDCFPISHEEFRELTKMDKIEIKETITPQIAEPKPALKINKAEIPETKIIKKAKPAQTSLF